MVDLCRAVGQIVHREWQFLALTAQFWLLICYERSDVGDHPLREAGGNPDGKSLLPWYERKHEILGIGSSPVAAAANILRGGRGARLRAQQVIGEDLRKHLVFRDLDSHGILWPDQLSPSLKS